MNKCKVLLPTLLKQIVYMLYYFGNITSIVIVAFSAFTEKDYTM